MPDYRVIQLGTDTSGRGVYVTRYMAAWWERVVLELGFEPTIVQGAFMTRNGGGAAASAGYHDQAGCLDLRTWDRAGSEVDRIIRVTRSLGAASWRRDARHGGMDPHIHLVLGTDQPLASGAAYQWRQYLAGRDGLAGNGPDYEWRPSPLVTTPPEEDPMAQYADQLDRIEKKVDRISKQSERIRTRVNQTARTLRTLGKAQTGKIRDDLERIAAELDALADDEA